MDGGGACATSIISKEHEFFSICATKKAHISARCLHIWGGHNTKLRVVGVLPGRLGTLHFVA